MKSLVTGGAGFIGSHLVEQLLRRGDVVRVLDDLSTGKKSNLASVIDRVEFIEGDVRDPEACRTTCQGMDVVFHQAALASVPRSIDEPQKTNEVNVGGTLNLLLASREAGVRRFVNASSSSIYGDSVELPKREGMVPNPLSPYALSKYAAETYVGLFFRLYGLETVSLRYFNVYGPRQDPNSQYAAVIPKFVSALLGGQSPPIFGDGKQTRDFTFVEDVVRANLLAGSVSREACGQTYNVAGGRKITIIDLFYSIRQLAVQKRAELGSIEPAYEAPRPGDPRDSLADVSRASRFLGFEASVDLKSGLQKTLNHFMNVSKSR